jgi:hypothetical protein
MMQSCLPRNSGPYGDAWKNQLLSTRVGQVLHPDVEIICTPGRRRTKHVYKS